MKNTAVGTIISRNYLAHARVLMRSFKRYHPEIPFYLVMADNYIDDLKKEAFNLISLTDLKIKNINAILSNYDHRQVLSALKPFFLNYLLTLNYKTAIFIDADILILNDCHDVLEKISKHSLTLTPHITSPPKEGFEAEQKLLFAGMFNGGLIGISNKKETRDFLCWWQQRLYTHCKLALKEGLHYDQRWLDLAPGFISDLYIIRETNCHVAYWNLADLDIQERDNHLYVDGQPGKFFHFSGFNPKKFDQLSLYAPNLEQNRSQSIIKLMHHYAKLLYEAGYQKTHTVSWPYSIFNINKTVTKPMFITKFEKWFILEKNKDSYWRWSSGESQIHISSKRNYVIKLIGKIDVASPRNVRLTINDSIIASYNIENSLGFDISFYAERNNQYTLKFISDNIPCQFPNDPRWLSFKIRDFTFKQQTCNLFLKYIHKLYSRFSQSPKQFTL